MLITKPEVPPGFIDGVAFHAETEIDVMFLNLLVAIGKGESLAMANRRRVTYSVLMAQDAEDVAMMNSIVALAIKDLGHARI